MLTRLAKLALVTTAFAPILVTVAFVAYSREQFCPVGVYSLLAAGSLILLCWCIILTARARLERLSFTVTSLKTVDQEVLGFVVTYLLPLIAAEPLKFDVLTILFMTSIFFVVIYGTHSYHFNPILGIFGFHFYEVQTTGNITYVLLTKRDLRNTKNVSQVVQISEYMVLDATE